MKVIKRDGKKEEVSFDKVLQRIRKAAKGLQVNPDALAQQVLSQLVDGVRTEELDELTAQLAASLTTNHSDWGILAARIAISNHHKQTSASFSETVRILANQTMPATGETACLLHPDLVEAVKLYGKEIDAHINYDRDHLFDYFGFKTLERSYLLKSTAMKVVERPQQLWMRVSLGLWFTKMDFDSAHLDDRTRLEKAFETYDLMSQKYFTHATPTLFNSGTPRQQLSSCFLLAMSDDSIAGIYKTLGDCAAISKYAGGIGLHIHNVRARGSLIKGTNGTSNGLIPMLRVFNNTARYVDQCFTPETLIYTKNGPKSIEDVEAGDYVITSGCIEEVDETGKHYVKPSQFTENYSKFCQVLKKVEHKYTGTLYHLTFDTHKTISVTSKHPFLVKNYKGEYNYVEVEKLNIGSILLCHNTHNGLSLLQNIQTEEVNDKTLYDLEIEGTHDYAVVDAGFAHNGGGKRNGSFAMYLEPWHADVEDFLKMKLNTGAEEERARDLFYALWIPDLFMERVEADQTWTVFCPNEAPGLAEVWGDAFKELYERYEREGRGRKTVSAQKLWFQILDSQMETGTPYILYKDAANRKSNQQNLGTIKSSNLCTEIIEYSNANETAVCNLASLALPAFVKDGAFDFEALRRVTKVSIRNLNRVIDINFYPTPETERSNKRHRPVGLGIQGLADVFAMLGLPWESDEAADLNQRIHEHMYFAAVEQSVALAGEEGSYETFAGSPASRGQLQPDLWGIKPLTETDGSLDWSELRRAASQGIRNSLLLAPMPTASTSQILGYNECFEPITSNLYTRRTLAGEFVVVNKYLMRDLVARGLWSEALKQKIVAMNGSVQEIPEIPADIKALYKTSYELKQRTLIDMAAARGAFICQSQSLNLFVADATYAKLTSMHFYSWKKGLKTGCYYLRTKAPVAAQKFTVDPRLLAAISSTDSKVQDNDDASSYSSASESESEDEEKEIPQQTPEEKRRAERQALLAKLAAEYEDEASKGCTMCSS